MTKMLLHDDEARAALARGIAKLTRAVQGTLGPRGMNAIIDRPIGTPIVSRDGVSIADEIELDDRFENMGAQVVREVAGQTNQVAGDGTTTATVLANAMVQDGLGFLAQGSNPVELVKGMSIAVEFAIGKLMESAMALDGNAAVEAVATIGAGDAGLGRLIADAIRRVGPEGTVTVDYGMEVGSTVAVAEGMSFDRGYISHHMVTDVESMQAVLHNPLILMTDRKIESPAEIDRLRRLVIEAGRSLLIIADEISPDTIVSLLSSPDADSRNGLRTPGGEFQVAAIHPPDFGHWRRSTMEDLAILTGGRVIARELGGRLEDVSLDDLGSAEEIRVSASETFIRNGAGDVDAIRARREQVTRQYENAPQNIERDKYAGRLAKLSGGTAVILAGGATPVEQKRCAQLLEDALNAARAAIEQGVVAGGGTALVQLAPQLDELLESETRSDAVKAGVRLVQQVMPRPLRCIAENCGRDADDIVARVQSAEAGVGFNAQTDEMMSMSSAGILDPVKVTCTALRNASSVASLILTTQTLIADRPDRDDPTAGPAMGGGGELLE